MHRLVLLGWLLALGMAWGAGEPSAKPDGGWSADLLTQILKSDPPKPDPSAAADRAPEMILRTYRLTNLRAGEAGKTQNVLAILNKLLPAGSSMNVDVPANSIHVLTTATAHAAIWDYLSAVDIPETTPPPLVPPEVKAALTKLAETRSDGKEVLAAVGALRTDVSNHLAVVDHWQRTQMLKLGAGAVLFAVTLFVTLAWMLRRRPPATPPADATALALAPDQLATALVPVQDKMRNDMLGLLNEVAIKLQAQHNEQQKLVREQQQQLEDARLALADERRQFISEAGNMVVQAVERVDATTAKLARQQDKVAELVQELQNTVRELDETKDNLRDREVELEQERAKIAALSLLLEEGAALPAGALTNGHNPEPHSPGANSNHDGQPEQPARFVASTPCTTPDPITPTRPRITIPSAQVPRENPPEPRFTFLPPDHPES